MTEKKKRFTSDALREKRRQSALRRWNDPETREKLLERIREGHKTAKYNRTITWGDKISAAKLDPVKRAARLKPTNCVTCGKEMGGYVKHHKYCSKKCRYDKLYREGIEGKARVLSANLLMGEGKQQILTEMLREALGTPCPYCGVALTLKNLQLDHIEPYGNSEQRRVKKENEAIRRHMDRRENLQFVCGRCNALKSNMKHEHFTALNEFLNQNAELKAHIETRLMRSLGFSRRFGIR
jgi:hypothetical protein